MKNYIFYKDYGFWLLSFDCLVVGIMLYLGIISMIMNTEFRVVILKSTFGAITISLAFTILGFVLYYSKYKELC